MARAKLEPEFKNTKMTLKVTSLGQGHVTNVQSLQSFTIYQ